MSRKSLPAERTKAPLQPHVPLLEVFPSAQVSCPNAAFSQFFFLSSPLTDVNENVILLCYSLFPSTLVMQSFYNMRHIRPIY